VCQHYFRGGVVFTHYHRHPEKELPLQVVAARRVRRMAARKVAAKRVAMIRTKRGSLSIAILV
jgi:hypothetical protein